MNNNKKEKFSVHEDQPTNWFEPLYANSNVKGEGVPWANMDAHPSFRDWKKNNQPGVHRYPPDNRQLSWLQPGSHRVYANSIWLFHKRADSNRLTNCLLLIASPDMARGDLRPRIRGSISWSVWRKCSTLMSLLLIVQLRTRLRSGS